MAVDIATIIKQLQDAQSQANAANELRYQQGMGTLQTGLGTMRGLYGQANSLIGDIGKSAATDIGMGAARQQAAGRQGLISSGLGNTTIVGSMMRGVEEDRRRAMERSEESMAQLRAGLATQEAGAEMGAAGGIANFISARNDIGPDPGLYSNLIQQAMAGENTGPVTVRTLGPMAQAGLTATGQPFKYTGGAYGAGGGGGSGFSQSSSMIGGSAGGGSKATVASDDWRAGQSKPGSPASSGGISSGMAAATPAPTQGTAPGAAAGAAAGADTGTSKLTPEMVSQFKRWDGMGWGHLVPDWARKAMGI